MTYLSAAQVASDQLKNKSTIANIRANRAYGYESQHRFAGEAEQMLEAIAPELRTRIESELAWLERHYSDSARAAHEANARVARLEQEVERLELELAEGVRVEEA